MADMAVQRFFETPVIVADIADPAALADPAESAALVETAITLARRFTQDVTQPQTPRFAWTADVDAVRLAPGDARPVAHGAGGFWTAVCCLDAGDAPAGLRVEDPRATMIGQAEPGLRFRPPEGAAAPLVEALAMTAGRIAMFPAFLRHGLDRNPGSRDQHWLIIRLHARRVAVG